jgi:hypothetical protein
MTRGTLSDQSTGEDLVKALRDRAWASGVPVRDLALQLSPSPERWLSQTRQALRPKPHTIARVRALLAGDAVPAPPANNFQASPRAPARIVVAKTPRVETHPAPVSRDPCFLCGTRGDIGCRHQRPTHPSISSAPAASGTPKGNAHEQAV